jgi:prepilin-type N-terminal cleavage/methylation domain-containing protein
MKNNAGMTFIEVLIALFIFTLMVSAVFPVFLTTRKMDLTTKAYTEGRQLAQTRLEWIYDQSRNLSYADTLYQLSTTEAFTCSGFSWTIDAITLEVLYNTPSSIVTCTKTVSAFSMTIVLTKDASILSEDFVEMLMTVTEVSTSTPIKLYETHYATGFLP